jgi:hypothetical protein
MTANRTRLLLGLMTFGVALGVATIGAPHAKADLADDTFVAQLDSKGVAYTSVDVVVHDAHAVCKDMRNQDPIMGIMSDLVNKGGWNSVDSATIIYEAVYIICPDTIPYLQAEANGRTGP